MFNRFPVLQQEHVRIMPFTREHIAPRYVAWLNDPMVVQYSEQRHSQHTIESCTQYFESIEKRGHYFLAIETTRENHGHIGNIGVTLDRHNGIADMAILVGEKSVWGTGIASIAWLAVLKELLSHHEIRKLTAGTMAVNESMLRLMSRSGMHIESIRARHFLWQGQEVDLVQAAIFKSNA